VKKYLIALAIIVPVLAILLSPLFIKVKVSCKSQYGECGEEIDTKLNAISGKSWSRANKEVAKILKNERLVSDFSTQFKLPSNLEVNILLKKPEFALFSTQTNTFALIGYGGDVLSISDKASLPRVVTGSSLPGVGDRVEGRTLTALKLVAGVFEMYQIEKGEMGDNSLVVDLAGGLRVLFPLEDKDPEVLLGTLRLIVSRITTEELSGKYREIDLRFKNPVLR
jgi:hypothetical protein